MLSKRVIPCLDVAGGRVVKGRQFQFLEDRGDPVELARLYSEGGADELVFLDIAASNEGRETMVELVARVARELFIPFTVGGGIRSESDVRRLLRAGADKVAIQTAAVARPALVAEAAAVFGSQCVVVSIDAQRHHQGWEVFTHGARRRTGLDALRWAEEVERLGAGELLLTSIDADGGRSGYDLELTRAVAERVRIPVIASGGAGGPADLLAVLTEGRADAALAASIFHSGDWTIAEVKAKLRAGGVAVRL
ncbi:MAG TPA: imidazole glycerol phosphate synthase subunit HisF [Candidatus Dormibacteraeota bacterium]|nr:imidazole glycerol phosphate synthase subunit HisF [Candidatus Dormibacteraeota bacterium]